MLPIDAATPPAAAMENPQRAFEASETRSAIRASLLALRPDRRRAVNQHLAGRSVSEIMASNGWSVPASAQPDRARTGRLASDIAGVPRLNTARIA